MKHSTWFRATCLLLATVAALAMPRPALANPIVSYTLGFEREGLDLDTGTIVPIEPWTLTPDPADPQPDLVLACSSERAVRAVVFHNRMNGVEIAFLDGVPFNPVDSTDLAGLSFTAEVIDEPFETGDSVVLRTDTGSHYLLGNPVEETAGVTFDTQLLGDTTAGSMRAAMDDPEPMVARASIPRNETQLSTGDRRQIRRLIEEDGYRFRSIAERPGTFTTRNATHRLDAALDGSGLRLSSTMVDDWDWNLALAAYGYVGSMRPVDVGELVAEGNRAEHRRGELVEWYVNDGRGLEQGFTLSARPAGEPTGPLTLKLAASGSLRPLPTADGSGAQLVDGFGRTVLHYAGLLAWDATGSELPARLAAAAGGLTIEVDDAGAVYPVMIDPTVVHEDAKLTASDAALDDQFGRAVAISGDTAIVGALADDDAGITNAGSAYVFVRDGTSWSEQAKLTASDAAADDRFGISVAISGDTAVVGATRDDYAGITNAGSAYVFVRDGTNWSQQTKLTASDSAAGDGFGISVAVSGDTAVVGASLDDHAGGTDAGSAYVFVRDGTNWSAQTKLTASDSVAGDGFGISVAVSGDTAVVGAPFSDQAGTDAGSAYVFMRNGANWSEQAKLTASDDCGLGLCPGGFFGYSVSLFGDSVVVGALLANSAYVFVRSGTSWSEQAKLTANCADGFGLAWSVALAGDTVVVGSHQFGVVPSIDGSACVFLRNGTNWSEQSVLISSDAAVGNFFGVSVSLSGNTAVVGASGFSALTPGSAYVFQFNQPPVALCMDITISAGFDCTTDASIDAASFDPDGDAITLSQDPAGPYGLGDTLVTLTVTDAQGASDSCIATVTVEDTTPPELTVTLTPDTLWPPNHRMVEVEASAVPFDACSTPSVVLTSVTSNEADNGVADGNTVNDIQDAQPGTPDFDFKLRAERAGGGNGRIYTALYTATDAAGNAGSAAGFAVVPHDQGGMTDPLELFLEENGNGTLVEWNAASGAQSYDVIRGQFSNVVETDVAISLGPVTCIESSSTDGSTAGWEDSDLPNPGQAFFYLVEYDDGTSSTYGAESADKPRAVGPGDCQ